MLFFYCKLCNKYLLNFNIKNHFNNKIHKEKVKKLNSLKLKNMFLEFDSNYISSDSD